MGRWGGFGMVQGGRPSPAFAGSAVDARGWLHYLPTFALVRQAELDATLESSGKHRATRFDSGLVVGAFKTRMSRFLQTAAMRAVLIGLLCSRPAWGQTAGPSRAFPEPAPLPQFEAAEFLGQGAPPSPHRINRPWARPESSPPSVERPPVRNVAQVGLETSERSIDPGFDPGFHDPSPPRVQIQPVAHQSTVIATEAPAAANRPLLSPRRQLDLRGSHSAGDNDGASKPAALDPARSLLTTGGGLAIALGAFFVLLWVWRKRMPQANQNLPGGVLEVLGRSTLDGKHRLHLVKLGGKLLLVSSSTAGAETLAEIDDPDEVTRLIGMCVEGRPGSSTRAFRDVLSELAQERGTPRRGKRLSGGDERSNLQAALRRVQEDARG